MITAIDRDDIPFRYSTINLIHNDQGQIVLPVACRLSQLQLLASYDPRITTWKPRTRATIIALAQYFNVVHIKLHFVRWLCNYVQRNLDNLGISTEEEPWRVIGCDLFDDLVSHVTLCELWTQCLTVDMAHTLVSYGKQIYPRGVPLEHLWHRVVPYGYYVTRIDWLPPHPQTFWEQFLLAQVYRETKDSRLEPLLTGLDHRIINRFYDVLEPFDDTF